MLVTAFLNFTPAGQKSMLGVNYEWNTIVCACIHISYHIVQCSVFCIKCGKVSTEEDLSFHEFDAFSTVHRSIELFHLPT